jgi:hypothetical protein
MFLDKYSWLFLLKEVNSDIKAALEVAFMWRKPGQPAERCPGRLAS